MSVVPKEFYLDDDVVSLGQKLLGKYLFTKTEEGIVGGIITETESYKGPFDKASHAYNSRRTPRNEVMYHKGGIAYVYICYGIHHLLNIVTNREEIPHAILIRSIKPTFGLELMLKRRKKETLDETLTMGPGNVSQALDVTRSLNGESLTGSRIWIEDGGLNPKKEEIHASPRVGIDYAGEHALLPWRFRLRGYRYD